MEWNDRVVLITGGTRGIGFATARLFLEAGASVMVTGRDERALSDALARLDGGSRARGVSADVRAVAGCRAAVSAATSAYGRLDVLFTNAGGYRSAPLGEVSEELWDETLDTHVKGTFFCTQAAVPALRETRGCVVTMASDAGLSGLRGGWAAYCAAMGGVVNLTRQLAVDLAPGVRVNAVAPGPVGTGRLYADLSRGSYGGFEGAAGAVEAITQTLPMRRLAEPDEVARTVLFLAGMTAMTGTVLSVDAGTTAALP